MYINSIHYFRAIAIMFIVFGHCFGISDFVYASTIGKTALNLTKGGTSFFVFISGFLFHHVFYSKFKFNAFYLKKIKHLLIPYLILSSIPILYLMFRSWFSLVYSSSSHSVHYEVLSSFPVLKHYLMGVVTSFKGYWYIPFILIVFALSPIFVKFIKLTWKAKVTIAVLLLINSVFMHRGTFSNGYTVFQNVLFFIPVYLFGILASQKREEIYKLFCGKEFYILTVIIGFALIQVYTGNLGNYNKEPFSFGGIDLMLIQKLLFCFFFMIFLNRFENFKCNILNIIATNSFGIYFLHGIIIWIIENFKEKFDFLFMSNSFMVYSLASLFVFSFSLLATLIIKAIFPKYSRYLIGC